jgi:hypothetical protein
VLVRRLLRSPYYLAMPPKLILLALAALSAVACAIPATAAAGEIVPPGNSAVNQYTETFPTSEGEEQSSLEKKKGVTPNEVLGAGNTKKLDDKGTAGKAVAQFTAETAPSTSADSGGDESTKGDAGNGKGDDGGKGKGKQPNSGGKDQNGGPEEGESSASPGSAGSGSGPSGSSAVGEIASQATGTASDSIGLWLPLILIAVVVWSGFYVWRNRQQRVV